ncbi:MAG: zinc ribbon domain-containing protein [Nitrososphaerota archaeon]|nr:zinc ribbon domain-containing protein [Nitrososphaerota archaeon]MDG6916862.1 zinc ribbon domain-containing protein [Nitrososphaerota archaeon]
MPFCPHCGNTITADTKWCTKCGIPVGIAGLSTARLNCSNCGQPYPVGAVSFCRNCGSRLGPEVMPSAAMASTRPTPAAVQPRRGVRKTKALIGATLMIIGLIVVAVSLQSYLPNYIGAATSTAPAVSESSTSKVQAGTSAASQAATSSTSSLVFNGTGRIISISSNGGMIGWSPDLGGLESYPSEIYTYSRSAFSYDQNVEIQAVYEPLQRDIFDSLGKVISVSAYGSGNPTLYEASIVLINSSLPSVVPLSWQPSLGDRILVDVYQDNTVPLVLLEGIEVNLTSPNSLEVSSSFMEPRSPSQCFDSFADSIECVMPAGQQIEFNLTLGYTNNVFNSNTYYLKVNATISSVSDNATGFPILSIRPALPIGIQSTDNWAYQSITLTIVTPSTNSEATLGISVVFESR